MEVTVAEAVRAYPGLERLANKDLPQTPAWRLGRWIDFLRPVVERYNRHRTELIMRYGKENAEGEIALKPTIEAQEAYAQEYGELMETNESISYNPIPLSLFRRTVREDGKDVVKPIELNASDLARAIKFFHDDIGLDT